MPFVDKLSRLLLAPPVTGLRAYLYGIALIAAPTCLRLLVDDVVSGWLPFFFYMPFLIVAAALLNWKHAAVVAMVSWMLANILFVDPRYQFSFTAVEIIGFTAFSISAILTIILVEAVRSIVENSLRPTRPDSFSTPVVFSLDCGQAWVSWYGSHSWVRLGEEELVAEMMEDFLAQRALGKRLARAGATVPG